LSQTRTCRRRIHLPDRPRERGYSIGVFVCTPGGFLLVDGKPSGRPAHEDPVALESEVPCSARACAPGSRRSWSRPPCRRRVGRVGPTRRNGLGRDRRSRRSGSQRLVAPWPAGSRPCGPPCVTRPARVAIGPAASSARTPEGAAPSAGEGGTAASRRQEATPCRRGRVAGSTNFSGSRRPASARPSTAVDLVGPRVDVPEERPMSLCRSAPQPVAFDAAISDAWTCTGQRPCRHR